MIEMLPGAKILVAGGAGLVGSALLRRLAARGYQRLVTTVHHHRAAVEGVQTRFIDLRDSIAVATLIRQEAPDIVILAAARVGGIVANNVLRADFLHDNLTIQDNVIHQSYKCGVRKLLFLGSTCIYPRDCAQPIREEYLLTGPLEYTNEPYAIAKIAGIKQCESYNLQFGTNFICAMPTNLYGPEDNFDLEHAHVLPALVRKFYLAQLLAENRTTEIQRNLGAPSWAAAAIILERNGISAYEVVVWGSGQPRRELMWSEDAADGCIFLLENVAAQRYTPDNHEIRNTHINLGIGVDCTIAELAELTRQAVGFSGRVAFDTSRPDGTPAKLTDITKINALGWHASVSLHDGVQRLVNWYKQKQKLL